MGETSNGGGSKPVRFCNEVNGDLRVDIPLHKLLFVPEKDALCTIDYGEMLGGRQGEDYGIKGWEAESLELVMINSILDDLRICPNVQDRMGQMVDIRDWDVQSIPEQ